MTGDITTINLAEVRFGDAVKALLRLAPVSSDEFNALDAVARQRAFSFAGAYRDSVAQAALDVLADAAGGELSESQFADKINSALQRYDMTIDADQANLIYQMALSKVFNRGALNRVVSSPEISAAYPYWGIDTAKDSRCRFNHYALDWRRISTVFRLSDELLRLWVLPAGFNCRCARRFFSQDDVAKFGLAIGNGMEWYGRMESVTLPGGATKTVAILPDPGFGGSLTAKSILDAVVLTIALKACTTIRRR
jgi:hypothetical protein